MEEQAQLKKIVDLREKYAQQRIDLKLGKLTDTSQMKKTRRGIAQALTELNKAARKKAKQQPSEEVKAGGEKADPPPSAEVKVSEGN